MWIREGKSSDEHNEQPCTATQRFLEEFPRVGYHFVMLDGNVKGGVSLLTCGAWRSRT